MKMIYEDRNAPIPAQHPSQSEIDEYVVRLHEARTVGEAQARALIDEAKNRYYNDARFHSLVTWASQVVGPAGDPQLAAAIAIILAERES